MAPTEADPAFSILIVPGSFVTPVAYEPLAQQLRSQGYSAQPIPLLSANDATVFPPPTTADDAAHIRQAVLSVLDAPTNPKNVVLALHSYSGVPGTSALAGLSKAARAAQGRSTAVTGIVYLAAFILPLGMGNRQFNNASDQPPAEPIRSGVPDGYLPAVDPAYAPYVFNDIESEEERAMWMRTTFTRQSSASFDGGVAYEAWKEIPSVSVIAGEDFVVPTRHQEKMFADAVAAGGKVERVFLEGVGHFLTVTAKERVAAEIIKLGTRESERSPA